MLLFNFKLQFTAAVHHLLIIQPWTHQVNTLNHESFYQNHPIVLILSLKSTSYMVTAAAVNWLISSLLPAEGSAFKGVGDKNRLTFSGQTPSLFFASSSSINNCCFTVCASLNSWIQSLTNPEILNPENHELFLVEKCSWTDVLVIFFRKRKQYINSQWYSGWVRFKLRILGIVFFLKSLPVVFHWMFAKVNQCGPLVLFATLSMWPDIHE